MTQGRLRAVCGLVALAFTGCGERTPPLAPSVDTAASTGTGASASVRGASSKGPADVQGVMTVVNGDTGEPVAGATLTVAGRPFTTDASGQFTAPDPVLPDQQVDITAAGFLKRETLTRSETRFALWPDRSNAPVGYTQEAVYTPGFSLDAKLTRPSSGVFVVMSAGVDADARAAHADAAAMLTAANGGKIPFTVADAAPAGAATVTVSVDGSAAFFAQNPASSAFADLQFSGNVIGGPNLKIVYKDAGAAKLRALAAHEMGHHFGVGHPSSIPGLMNAAIDPNRGDYSESEKLVMRMMVQRRPGNAFPDNDRAVTAATSGRRGQVFVCYLISALAEP